MYDLKKVIEANTNDGVIDYEKVMGEIDNSYVNPIIAKKTDKSKLMPEAVNEVIKGLGIEGESLDDLKLYVKKLGGSTDEAKEENLKLMKQVKELEEKYNIEVDTRSKLEKDAQDKKQLDLIKGLGITDEKQIEFFKWDFNNQVTEEKSFELVVEEYAKNNDVKTTTKFIKDDFGAGGSSKDLDIATAWKERRSHTRTK